jgi:hypothetical protein
VEAVLPAGLQAAQRADQHRLGTELLPARRTHRRFGFGPEPAAHPVEATQRDHPAIPQPIHHAIVESVLLDSPGRYPFSAPAESLVPEA